MQFNLKSALLAVGIVGLGVAISFAAFLRSPKVFRASAELSVGEMRVFYRRSVSVNPLVPLDFLLESHAGVQVGIDPVSNPSLVFARRLPRVEILPTDPETKTTTLLVYGTSAAQAQELLTKSVATILEFHKKAFAELTAEHKQWVGLNRQCGSTLKSVESGKVASVAALSPCFLRDQFENHSLWASAQSVELTQTRLVKESPAPAPIRSDRRQHLIVGVLLGGALLGALYSFNQLRRIRAALPA